MSKPSWWDHRISTDSLVGLPQVVLPRLIEAFGNTRPFTDGEIFWKYRYYSKHAGSHDRAQEWLSRLTVGKQKDVRLLLKYDGYREAFDDLLDLPGLWRPLKLGTLQRLLALHCDEESLPLQSTRPSSPAN